MRSARMLLATGAASAVLALGAPGAYAYAYGGDSGHGDSGYSKEDSGGKKEDGGKEDGFGKKEHDKDGGFGKPHGGMHTGGGALTAVNGDWGSGGDPKYDPETYKDKDKEKDWGGEKSWGGESKKPHGGMHTGGGALANPGVTAGGLAVLAVAGAGLYAARRKKSAAGLA